jgi:hypothetical protein
MIFMVRKFNLTLKINLNSVKSRINIEPILVKSIP